MSEPMSDDAYWDYLATDREHERRMGTFAEAVERVRAEGER